MADTSDQQLIKNYLLGDEKSLEILVKKYLPVIYNFSYKYVGDEAQASDIAQETFVKAWKNLKKYKSDKKFSTWIFAIAKNCAIDYLRRKKEVSFSALEDEEGNNQFLNNVSAEDISFTDIESSEIKDAIQKLSPQQQVVIYLHYQQDQTFEEIAHILHEPLNTCKSRHRRALHELKEILTK